MSISKYVNNTVKQIGKILAPVLSLTNNLFAVKPGTALDATQGKVLNDKFGDIDSFTYKYFTSDIIGVPIIKYGYREGRSSKFTFFPTLANKLANPDYIWKGDITSGKTTTITCGFRARFIIFSLRYTSTTNTAGGVYIYDMEEGKLTGLWGANTDPKINETHSFVTSVSDNGFTISDSTNYCVMFVYK